MLNTRQETGARGEEQGATSRATVLSPLNWSYSTVVVAFAFWGGGGGGGGTWHGVNSVKPTPAYAVHTNYFHRNIVVLKMECKT